MMMMMINTSLHKPEGVSVYSKRFTGRRHVDILTFDYNYVHKDIAHHSLMWHHGIVRRIRL